MLDSDVDWSQVDACLGSADRPQVQAQTWGESCRQKKGISKISGYWNYLMPFLKLKKKFLHQADELLH